MTTCFSFHEMAVHDTPAMVDYVMNMTGVTSHYHVGSSLGSTVLFAFLAEKPVYNQYTRLLVAQAPSVILKGAKNAIYTQFTEVSIFRFKTEIIKFK